jgi:hypothetical protein
VRRTGEAPPCFQAFPSRCQTSISPPLGVRHEEVKIFLFLHFNIVVSAPLPALVSVFFVLVVLLLFVRFIALRVNLNRCTAILSTIPIHVLLHLLLLVLLVAGKPTARVAVTVPMVKVVVRVAHIRHLMRCMAGALRRRGCRGHQEI